MTYPDRKADSTAVAVVGGGLVGLSQAVFLAWQGVSTVLIERHPGSSPHPRAIGFTPRTLELLRAVGLGARVPQVPPGLRLRRIKVESLAGKWFDEIPWHPEAEKGPAVEYSPCTGAALAQDRLEPILREHAASLGADIRLDTELLRFEQDAGGVTLWQCDRGGHESRLRVAYLVAADGHRSPVREGLGIGRSGRGFMRTARSVLFRAPLEEYLRSGIAQFEIEQPDFSAFLTTYGDGRWVLFLRDDVELDDAALKATIYKALGRTDLPIELIVNGRWEISALIADRFSSGRIFLAGDSAHTLPPNRGGYGANTGIEDAHNLAWKLAAVLAGRSGPALLETYDAERRPIAWLRHNQIFARIDYQPMAAGAAKGEPLRDDAAMEFGQLYRSTAVLDAGAALPPALRPEAWAGQPGTRAPHLWIARRGERLSTLDLFQPGWVLLADDERWSAAVAQAREALELDLRSVPLRAELSAADAAAVREAFGLQPGGASLVRPDGYIAWRALELPADPAGALLGALRQVASVGVAS